MKDEASHGDASQCCVLRVPCLRVVVEEDVFCHPKDLGIAGRGE